MSDTFEFTLNNPLTEEQWDMIADVDMERTDNITFHTKHGKEVEFAKVRHGKWKKSGNWGRVYKCDQCGSYLDFDGVNAGRGSANYCPNCGARMDAERKED